MDGTLHGYCIFVMDSNTQVARSYTGVNIFDYLLYKIGKK
jgi:hypothetical protein